MLLELFLGKLRVRLVRLSEFGDKHLDSFFGGKAVVFAWLLAEKGNDLVILTRVLPFRKKASSVVGKHLIQLFLCVVIILFEIRVLQGIFLIEFACLLA